MSLKSKFVDSLSRADKVKYLNYLAETAKLKAILG
jgi:hypothetical protein